ncbi:MAG: hypothetical protein ACPG43_11055 [Alcanivoracaceae bacterium]
MSNVVAVPANPALVNGVDDFLHAVAHERSNSAEKFIEMVDHMTDRMLSLFLVEPSQLMALSGTQKKVIDFAVSTAGKASHMLTRQIYKKTSNKEFAPIVRNIEAMYWPAGNDNDNQACLVIDAPDDLARDFYEAQKLCEAGNGTAHIELVASVFDRLSDEVIDSFFVSNTHEVKIGFVTQKALNVGIDGSRKAVHAVTNKVLRGLNDEQLKGFLGHYAGIIRPR